MGTQKPDLTDSGRVADVQEAGALLVLRNEEGKQALELSAPVMTDAKGESYPVDARLARADDGWRLSLTPDGAWLDDPDRSWPVTIDPDVFPSPNPDCLLSAAASEANGSFCAANFLEAGWGQSPAHDHHALLKFDVPGAVPAGSDVLHASLNVNLISENGTAPPRRSASTRSRRRGRRR